MTDIELTADEARFVIPNGATTIPYGRRGLNWKGRFGYNWMVWRNRRLLNAFYTEALSVKACFYGPFVGEFGHFLLHNLPFLVHLHRQGVQIHYCGMELHKPFLVDEEGNSIVHQWYPLRDFFGENRPVANQTKLPENVAEQVGKFKSAADRSGLPFLDISDSDMYWFVYRNWQLQNKQSHYDLSKFYGSGKSKSCVIFPRKKGAEFSPNNGGPWDYGKMAKAVSPYFEKVYLVGHPSLSAEVKTGGNVELKVSSDNAETLKFCADADLIITQHSGAVHLGSYVKTPVLIAFNGEPPIKGLIDTIRFRKNLTDTPLSYAFSLKEIVTFVSQGF